MAPSDGAMGTVVTRIGAAMGWLIERAKERQRNLKAGGTIASLAWKPTLKGALGSHEALANRLRKLDAGEGVEWWASAEGRPYMEAVAGVLKLPPTEFATWLAEARPTPDDDARWFHFEVFPALRPLDLDTEDPFPGVPRELFAGDGPTQLTWWHAPQGAGRTILGRWLVRRHRWTFATPDSATERSFIEQHAIAVPKVGRARRVIVASPHPMPAACRTDGWTEVVTPMGWELELVKWVAERRPVGGSYDQGTVEAFVRDGRVTASTPGQLLEILADVDALGVDALSDQVPPDVRLAAWVRAHAGRADRTARSASRTHLREHGADLLREIEMTRLHRGINISRATVIACFPEPVHASADAIRAAHEAGDVEGALQLIRPRREDLAETMVELRWIIAEGWGFPTRVAGWLRQCVAHALVQGSDIRMLGVVADTPEMVLPVLNALATPASLAAWTGRLEAVTALEPETALGLDAIVLAMTLSEALGHTVTEDVRNLLRESILRLAGEDDVAVSLQVDERWSALAWLVLFAPVQPPTDRQRRRAHIASQFLHDNEEQPTLLGPLRLLAADRLGDLAAMDKASYRSDLASAAVADLAAGVPPEPQALTRLQAVRRLDVAERLCRRWASSLEEVASLLWSTWEHNGVPEDADLVRLGRVWATCPPEHLRGGLYAQLLDHIRRGVELPDALWRAALGLDEPAPEILEHAPVAILFDWADRFTSAVPAVLWRRAPADTLTRVAELLEVGADAGHWLRVAPAARTQEVLAMLPPVETPPPGSLAWSDRVIAGRAPGWSEVWKWRMA
jgi:hypothetical protein